MMKLAFGGNEAAKTLMLALAGTALNELFCDAFGVVSDASTRQAQLTARLAGIEVRRTLTDSIAEQYIEKHEGCEKVPFYAFVGPSDELNRLLTGYPAKYWKEKLGVATDDLLRDRWGRKQLARVKSVEELAQAQMDNKGLTPIEAVRFAVDALGFTVWPEDALLGDKGDYQKHYMRQRRQAQRSAKV